MKGIRSISAHAQLANGYSLTLSVSGRRLINLDLRPDWPGGVTGVVRSGQWRSFPARWNQWRYVGFDWLIDFLLHDGVWRIFQINVLRELKKEV